MRIYIDETGPFLPPSQARQAFSLVVSLIVPTSIEQDLFYEFLRLRDTWPNQTIEIKGSSLNEAQAAQLISLVLGYDVLVQFVALDMNTHPDSLVEKFKNRQADAITANITREHHPGPLLHLHQLGEAIRSMPNQLFLQAWATWQLVIRTIREGTLYYVQRQPKELGDIAWFVDRKDRDITVMEDTWSTLILPLGENAFAREPLACVREEDYSYFDARYSFVKATADPEMQSHMEWMSKIYGLEPESPNAIGIDAKRLLTEQLTFADSRDSLGLQLTDMLAAILRRALNDRLQLEGWKDFGGLLIRHREPGTGFYQLGPGEGNPRMTGHARTVCKVLHLQAKDMIANRIRLEK